MTNHDLLAEIGHFFGYFLLQQRHQRRGNLPFIQHKIFEFLGIGHASNAIVLFDQLVTGADVGRGHLFLRRKFVFDNFEDPIESGQSKHQHHHAAYPRCFDKLFIAAGQIQQIFTVAFGFRMLLTANRHIQLGGSFTGQDLTQPLDQCRRQRRVDHKVRAGKTKHNAGFRRSRQTSIDKQFAFVSAVNRQ